MDGVVDVGRGVAPKRMRARGGREVRLPVSAEQRERILAEAALPGAVLSAVARRWGVSPQCVFGWRRRAHREQLAADASAEPIFVPIVADGSTAAGEREGVASRLGPGIEMRLAGAELRIAPGTDGALLTTVLCAIRASAA
jgi:transposase